MSSAPDHLPAHDPCLPPLHRQKADKPYSPKYLTSVQPHNHRQGLHQFGASRTTSPDWDPPWPARPAAAGARSAGRCTCHGQAAGEHTGVFKVQTPGCTMCCPSRPTHRHARLQPTALQPCLDRRQASLEAGQTQRHRAARPWAARLDAAGHVLHLLVPQRKQVGAADHGGRDARACGRAPHERRNSCARWRTPAVRATVHTQKRLALRGSQAGPLASPL